MGKEDGGYPRNYSGEEIRGGQEDMNFRTVG